MCSHLCSLILVEGIYLEWVDKYRDNPDEYVMHDIIITLYKMPFQSQAEQTPPIESKV